MPDLESDFVVLRPQTQADIPLLARWFLDPRIKQWLQLSEDPPEYCTVEAVGQRFARLNADVSTELWRIDTREGRPIGQIELTEIHAVQRRAEIHLCIGEIAVQQRGYGTDAVRRLVRHAFEDLNLRRVWTYVDADNARCLRCLEKAGFSREGLLRRHRLRHGEPVDMVALGILNG
jgi:RimJ/RimL family protein N-acetyltransferase